MTAICNWIHDNLEYLPGSSHGTTSAVDTIIDHAGVCRDFAHLGITMCRAMDIPARYVSSYAFRLDPPDFHATFEAFLGGRWYLFDATRKAALDGLIRIGVGRDAAEVSFSSFFGKAESDEMKVSISSTDRGAGGRSDDPGGVAVGAVRGGGHAALGQTGKDLVRAKKKKKEERQGRGEEKKERGLGRKVNERKEQRRHETLLCRRRRARSTAYRESSRATAADDA